MSILTLFGVLNPNSKETKGNDGRGIGTIQANDNNDGSVTLTFNMTDSSTYSTTTTLTSDNLNNVNKILLSGSNLGDKLQVQDETDAVVFNVNTVIGTVGCNDLYVGPDTYLTNAGLRATALTIGNFPTANATNITEN